MEYVSYLVSERFRWLGEVLQGGTFRRSEFSAFLNHVCLERTAAV